MNTVKQLIISLVIAIGLLGTFSWPLYRHFNSGIPHTSITQEEPPVRYMVMGDHLQLLYHFWLMNDWMTGDTPVGHNLYQFNAGDDSETACPIMDYVPYSVVFGILLLLFSRAASWNLTMLFSIWMAVYFAWRLLQLYEPRKWVSLVLAAMSVSLPYQWASLFGGSPTGFAMMVVPMLFYGMERAIRRAELCGGLLAAAALLISFWTDTHILLFSLILGPVWGVMILLHEETFPWKQPREWVRRALAALPLGLMALYTIYIRLATKADLTDTVVGEGRTWREISLFSPTWRGLMHRGTTGHDHTIYLGVLLVVLLLISVAIGAWRSLMEKRWRQLLHGLALAGLFAVAIAFALGPNGPLDAWVFVQARQWIPPIEMLRQPGKIFAMFAPLIGLLALPLWRLLFDKLKHPALKFGLPLVLTFLVVADWKTQHRTGVSLLATEQSAYAAVAADAEEPRAVVVPLWRGDSAWSSLYQHYASLHRLRLLNGYLPVVSQHYMENIVEPLNGINPGGLTPERIQFLQDMDIHYLIFHQNAFPEQVSWMPVGYTLKRFITHPQLELMVQDGPVWAFRILPEPDTTRPDYAAALEATRNWTVFGSRIQSEMEHEHRVEGAVVLEDEHASDGRFVRLARPGEELAMGGFVHQEATDARVLLRARGNAAWRYIVYNEGHTFEFNQRLDSDEWIWLDLPTPWEEDTERVRPAFRLEEGELDLDRMSFVSGQPPRLEPGESTLIPAATLYHAGYTDIKSDAVVLRPETEPNGRILYGPRWPLPNGSYEAEIVWAEPPPENIRAGALEIRLGLNHYAGSVPLTGHNDAPLRFSTTELNLPLEFGFYYPRQTELRIRGIRVTRIE